MARWRSTIFHLSIICTALAQNGTPSESCKSVLEACENDLECSNRLAPLMAACTTGTCQPQCRNAVLNVYQNKLGRSLLRSDASCIPGREELRTCNFLPTESTVHCSLAKLACEADLQCNAKWGVFVSECESESQKGECSAKCKELMASTIATPHGNAFINCTCTERDQLCQSLKDNILGACNKPTSTPLQTKQNLVTLSPLDSNPIKSADINFTFQVICILTAFPLFIL